MPEADLNVKVAVTTDHLNSLLGQTNLGKQVEWMLYLMVGTVIVVGVGFIGLVISVVVMFIEIAGSSEQEYQPPVIVQFGGD